MFEVGRPRRRHTERQGCALTTTVATPPVPRQRRPLPSGLLLIRAATSAVEVWAARGVVPVDVAPLEHGWVVVVPATGRTAVEPPYDDPVVLLVNRPVPARMRPAIGLVVRGGEAVVCVAARGWRSGRRWLAWSPGEGLVPPGGLPLLSLPSLVAASGVADPGALDALRDWRLALLLGVVASVMSALTIGDTPHAVPNVFTANKLKQENGEGTR